MVDLEGVGEILQERRDDLNNLKSALDRVNDPNDYLAWIEVMSTLDKLDESDLLISICGEMILALCDHEKMEEQ
jgi:hypothetical protein